MDPDEQEFHRRQAAAERQRLAQLEQAKQSVQPFVQAAQSGGFGIAPNAGKALLDAIHHCQDGLNDANDDLLRIRQRTKLGISPDALVMTTFNGVVATEAVTALDGLREILARAEAGVTEAIRHYHRADEDGAAGITRIGN